MNENISATWPGWSVTRLIGRGSFGAVYEIERELFGETERAALKVISIPQSSADVEELRNDGYNDESITKHFESCLRDIIKEYSIMAKLKGHTNIVDCDDVRYVQHDDGFGWDIYIKMELLTSLPKSLDKDVTAAEVIKLGVDMCAALTLCKSRSIIHRDIKPPNIFISRDGNYKLGDFGIAKTTEATAGGTKAGTYRYMAPEVYNNKPYGGLADLYSLGLVMYWLLNERRTPFLPLPPKVPTAMEDAEARDRRFAGEPLPPPAHGSAELKEIVLKACAFDPNDRFSGPEEMRAALLALPEAGEDTTVRVRRAREDEQRIRQEQELRLRREEEERQNREAELRKKQEEELRQKREEELRLRREEELRLKREAELKKKQEEERLKREREFRLRREEELRQKREAELRKKQEEELNNQRGQEINKTPRKKSYRTGIIIADVLVLCLVIGTILYARLDKSDDGTATTVKGSASGRTDVVEIALGDYHTAELRPDGTVAADGDNEDGQCDVDDWTDITSISVGTFHTVGLRSDGTVVAAGPVYCCDVEDWTDIVAVSAGGWSTVGLRSDGTVVADGGNTFGECDVDGWSDIVAISAGNNHTAGLHSDGTAVATGKNDDGRCDVGGWTGISAIFAGDYHTVGLRRDGTVVASGSGDEACCDLSGWTDIVAIYAGNSCTLGVRSDGTVVAAGDSNIG